MPRFLVVLDVDSTIIEDEVIELLAEAAGTVEKVRAVTSAAMNGKIDFEESLRTRVATLEGVSQDVFVDVLSRVRVTTGVPELIEKVHAAGGRLGVVSGGFHEVIDPLAAGLGFDRWRANSLDIVDGALSGRLRGSIVDAAAKATTLREWASVYRIPLSQTITVGDGANDLPMMRISGLSVAFDAKAPVRDEANVIMDVRDLTQLLPMLGLRG